jgi:hypothetical protein
MTEIKNGKQSVKVIIEETDIHNEGLWLFCENGSSSTGVHITVEQFDMVKGLVNNLEVVEFYEGKRQ